MLAASLVLAGGVSEAFAENSEAMQEASAAYRSGDYDVAFVLWKLEAEAGDPKALWLIGNMYATGQGVETDLEQAFTYYRKSADQNYAEAMVSLATMYRLGSGVSQDMHAATDLLYKAARADHPIAMFDLAQMFLTGEDGTVSRDVFHARQWFRLSAHRGVIMAQYKLAEMYFAGVGVPKEGFEHPDVIGFIWLEQAYLQAKDNHQNDWSRRVFPLDKVVPTDKNQRTLRQIIADRYAEQELALSADRILRAREILEKGDLAKL